MKDLTRYDIRNNSNTRQIIITRYYKFAYKLYLLISADLCIRTKVILKPNQYMTKLQLLQQLVEEKGELMVMSDTGEKFELHKHNVKFDDSSDLIEIDGGTKRFWLVPSKIAYYWTHDKAREE